MNLDAQKELVPVVYGKFSVKVLSFSHKAEDNCFRLHWHDRMELLRVREGLLIVYIGEEKNEISAGELAIIYPCQPHRGMAGEDGVKYDVIMFDITDFYNNTSACNSYLEPMAQEKLTFTNKTEKKEIISAVDSITELYSKKGKCNPLQIIGQVYSFLGLLYLNYESNKKLSDSKNQNFAPVIEYVNKHFREQISTGSLSSMFGYNEAYFSRCFKKVTGINAVKYIQILRLEYAQKLLKTTDENIAKAAIESGFGDVYYFTHCFKKHFGLSPSSFKKQNNQKNKA